jgi:uncharacterized protein (TIGR02594 family)
MENKEPRQAPDFETAELPDLDGILAGTSFGIQPARTEEIEKADTLLNAAPLNAAPLDVMRYFEGLQDLNIDSELYNSGWRVRWNPIIVRFFSATNFGKPSGDATSWCAASLNWCLTRSGYGNGTKSAASASFRNAPGATVAPKPGDIVVFVQNSDPNHGHVTLFLSEATGRIQCLGGNQTDQAGHHAICTKWISKQGSFLTFHSYHSVNAFR